MDLQPSQIIRMIIDAIRYRDETWLTLRFWMRERHPRYRYAKGTVLFAIFLGALTLVLFGQAAGTQQWELLYIPVAIIAIQQFWGVLAGLWQLLYNPDKHFGKYRRMDEVKKPARSFPRLLEWSVVIATFWVLDQVQKIRIHFGSNTPKSRITPNECKAIIEQASSTCPSRWQVYRTLAGIAVNMLF